MLIWVSVAADTDESQAACEWLVHGRSPWPTVLTKWTLTAPSRFRSICNHDNGDLFINTYLNSWAVLQHKSGHELVCNTYFLKKKKIPLYEVVLWLIFILFLLILEDFRLIYPSAADKLLSKWSLFASKTLSIALKDVKDPSIHQLASQAKTLSNEGENAEQLVSVPSPLSLTHSVPLPSHSNYHFYVNSD